MDELEIISNELNIPKDKLTENDVERYYEALEALCDE